MKIVNEECDYIIKNYEAALALEESLSRTRERVPAWLQREIRGTLSKEVSRLISDEEMEWKVKEYEDAIDIFPGNKSFYDDQAEVGAYYKIFSFTWDEIYDPESQDDGMWVGLVYDLPESRNKKKFLGWSEKQINKIRSKRSQISKPYVPLLDEDEEVLVVVYLNKILNLKSLSTPGVEKTIHNTVETIISFIESTHKLMHPFAK